MIRIREFDMEEDLKAVVELERSCDVGPASSSIDKKTAKKKKKSSVSLCVDQLGDPLARVCHVPDHTMLVAEYGEKREIVGVIRACIKTVTRGVGPTGKLRRSCRVAYILGLRVSSAHRWVMERLWVVLFPVFLFCFVLFASFYAKPFLLPKYF